MSLWHQWSWLSLLYSSATWESLSPPISNVVRLRKAFSGLILGLRPASERRRYKVTPSLTGWAQTWNQHWFFKPWHHNGFGQTFINCSALSYFHNQCWLISIWILNLEHQWDFSKNAEVVLWKIYFIWVGWCWHWSKQWLVTYSAMSHYLNQCWLSFNGTLRTNLSETLIKVHSFHARECICKRHKGTYISFKKM